MEAAEKFSTELGTAVACRAFGVPRASLYRRRQRGAAPAAGYSADREHRFRNHCSGSRNQCSGWSGIRMLP